MIMTADTRDGDEDQPAYRDTGDEYMPDEGEAPESTQTAEQGQGEVETPGNTDEAASGDDSPGT